MRCWNLLLSFVPALLVRASHQAGHNGGDHNVSHGLFTELEELARIVDISYCVGLTGYGISEPFECLSRCADFPAFELITTWNTGPLLSDSCGYIALDHGKKRIIVAFRGTYSITNTIVDLSTVPQKYVPWPGENDDQGASTFADISRDILEGTRIKRDVSAAVEPKCVNCTVHMGFHKSWLNTRNQILQDVQQQVFLYQHYTLNLVGHSLGGAVAALAGLDFQARGWKPQVTTFGEPRVGNVGFVKYLDERFHLEKLPKDDALLKYRRVTHVDDPVPLLPLTEWGYAMHAGEIHITRSDLPPEHTDLRHCDGDIDPRCIAGQDTTVLDGSASRNVQKRDLLDSVKREIDDVKQEPWGIPSRYKIWQLFFAHRDYFWRLGLCVPGGDPLGGRPRSVETKEDLR